MEEAEQERMTPVLLPPPAESPYLDDAEEGSGRKGQTETETALDAALHSHDDSQEVARRRQLPHSDTDPPRLEQKSQDVKTERPRPVHRLTTWLGSRRTATAEDILRRPPSRNNLSLNDSASSSDSPSVDEEVSIQDWAQPSRPRRQYSQLSQLNQIQRQPGTRWGDKDQSGSRSRKPGRNLPFSKVGSDGRLAIGVNEMLKSGYLAKALGLPLQRHLKPLHRFRHQDQAGSSEPRPSISTAKGAIPRLNIVIMVIGSRGDVQPFLKVGKTLKEKHGHRVRIATHPVFRDFVQRDSGLEFFSVGGDPSELMAFMVKNPGLIPSVETVRAGEIGRHRESMYKMFQGFWRACVNATDDEEDPANVAMLDDRYPFIADAIIANPPSFAHVHCAERLGIPLHLVFTFPYTPTQQFPHPLANIAASNVDPKYTNLISYPLVELMTWQGLGDLVNRFRVKTLGLEPLSTLWAPGQLFRLKVPYTYLWSPGLVPKPADWGPEIDIAGYVFLDLASNHRPAEDLVEFLARGEAPIYIGFGSISGVEDPDAFTKLVFEAVEKANVRAIISKGWGGMGRGMVIPDTILLVDNVPHDWLFPRVQAVVHHGGAGTTAAGLKCGKPTMIVPFFGDQPFWGAMVARAHAGAEQCLPLKKLTVGSFAEGIRQCLTDEARENAEEIAQCIEKEGDGAQNAVDSFHRALPLDGLPSLRCFIFPGRTAVWRYRKTQLHLSAMAAHLLVQNACLQWRDLQLLKHYEWDDFQGPGEPITGGGGSVISDLRDAIRGLSSVSRRAKRGLKMREKQKRRQQGHTVASAIAIPGRVAQQQVQLSMPAKQQQQVEPDAENVDQVNLRGSAAPAARPWLSVVGRRSTADLNHSILPEEVAGPASFEPKEIPDPPSGLKIVLQAAARGFGESGKVLIQLPFNMWYAIALGFHNAPRLYGDSSVRPPPSPITGFRSGVEVAGVEFARGVSDGLVGVFLLPRHDLKQKGALGVFTGLGKGVGGLIMKPTAGLVGLVGYTGKGIEVGVRKRVRDTGKTDRWIRRAHIAQGAKDLRKLSERKASDDDDGNGNGNDNAAKKATSHALQVWSTHQQHEAHLAAEQRRRKQVHREKQEKWNEGVG